VAHQAKAKLMWNHKPPASRTILPFDLAGSAASAVQSRVPAPLRRIHSSMMVASALHLEEKVMLMVRNMAASASGAVGRLSGSARHIAKIPSTTAARTPRAPRRPRTSASNSPCAHAHAYMHETRR